MKRLLIHTFIFLFCSAIAFPQNKIKLTHASNGKIIYLEQDTKIKYEMKGTEGAYFGFVKQVNADKTITLVNNTVVPLDTISVIEFSYRKLRGIPLMMAGTAIAATGIFLLLDYVNKFNLGTENRSDAELLAAAGLTAGGTIIASFGFIKLFEKKKYVLGKQWNWKVVSDRN